MLDLALLALLRDQPLHGYELRKQLAEVAGLRAGVSFGSLYPALGRLEQAGLVRTVDDAPAPRVPMTGSLGAEVAALRSRRPAAGRPRRNRKVYAITPAGEQRLVELLTERAPDERTFHVQVAFCRFLTPAARVGLFEQRRRELAARLQPADEGERRRDRYHRALRDRDLAALRAEIAWLDDLIDGERALAPDPSPTAPGDRPDRLVPTTTAPGGSHP